MTKFLFLVFERDGLHFCVADSVRLHLMHHNRRLLVLANVFEVSHCVYAESAELLGE